MKTKLLLITAIRSLMHHKGRSLLTILGIIVGISAIIATLAIGYGAEEKIRNQIMSMGNNYIELWAGRSFTQGTIKSTKLKQPKQLTENDVINLQQQCPGIKKITPIIFDQNIIEHQGIPLMGMIKAGNENIFSIFRRKIARGSIFTNHHLKKSSRVIVIGAQAARELFKYQNPLDKTIKINNVFYTIIGVLEPLENYFGGQDPNLDVFIPVTTAQKYLKNVHRNTIHTIAISAKNLLIIPDLLRQIRIIMRARHNLSLDEPDDFSYIDQQGILKASKSSSQTFNLFLFIVASISLLVGGIGVMNIMLVSVTERTKEIGIRMALGAPAKLILRQFLIETITLCLIGGFIGIMLGIIAPHLAHFFLGFPVIIKFHTIIIALIVIFLIGIIFGFYPARKASLLNPIEALQES